MDFKEKRRQDHINESYFNAYKKYILYALDYLERDSAGLNEDSDSYGKPYTPDPRGSVLYLFELITLCYTSGESIKALEPILEKLINYVPESVRVGSTSEDYGCDPLNAYVFDKMGVCDDLYNLVGLCILFDRPDLMETLIVGIDKLNNESAIESLIALLVPDYPVSKETLPRGLGFRAVLQKAIEAETEKETIAFLKKYLKSWYTGMRRVGWNLIDSHLEQQPEAPGYRGYWAFEVAAVAYFKNIDDTALRDSEFYPKDMVDYARKLNSESRVSTPELNG